MRGAVALYCLVVGASMVAWWGADLRGGVLRRSDRARTEVVLHLSAELATAALLLVGGSLLLAGARPIVALVALGMLGYTIVASPGSFLARREAGPVALFVVLAVLTVLAVVGAATL